MISVSKIDRNVDSDRERRGGEKEEREKLIENWSC